MRSSDMSQTMTCPQLVALTFDFDSRIPIPDLEIPGQLLVRVADSAMDLLGVRLKVLVDNQTDDNIKDALEEIFQKLDCLNVAASGLAKMSESLSGHIAQVNPITQPWLTMKRNS